jgi:hypothetical protein
MSKYNEREIRKITQLYNDLLRSVFAYSEFKSINNKITMWEAYTQFSKYYYKMGISDPILYMYIPFSILNIHS